jgi:MiaB-like tRNA modifying enzyme
MASSVRFYLETYGCTMNQGESLRISEQLMLLGHEVVGSAEEADVVLVNSCAVIEPTELKIMKRIRVLIQEGRTVGVLGCMPAVSKERLEKEFGDIMMVPPSEYDHIALEIESRFGRGEGGEAPLQHGVSLILPIAQGCLGNCTYCITKKARGHLQSRPLADLVKEAEGAIGAGSKEILLTAQDTGCYGMDLDTDLAQLVRSISDIEGDFRIRVGMMNPDSLDEKSYVPVWAHSKAYHFLHLPVQSGSDKILDLMGRAYSAARFEEQVAAFRKEDPLMTLATDIITGFPGEVDDDHRRTVELVERIRPSIVNVTRFSPRPGTPAAKAKSQVPSWIAKERSREITAQRFRIAREHLAQFEGQDVEVLCTERGKGTSTIARDDRYVQVVLKDTVDLGQRVTARILSATGTHLMARLVA